MPDVDGWSLEQISQPADLVAKTQCIHKIYTLLLSLLLFPFTSSQSHPYPTQIATSTPISWVSRFLCRRLPSSPLPTPTPIPFFTLSQVSAVSITQKGRKFSALFLEGFHQQLLDLKAWAHTRSEMGVNPVELFDCLSFNSLLPKRNEDLLQWYIISIR